MSNNFKLVTIDQRFIAETIAKTGTDQILDKGWRGYVGIYSLEENWYLPLHGRKPKRKPNKAFYETPFESRNLHFNHPGLDFQKALFVPRDRVIEIKNTLPKEQSKFIERNFEDIQRKFENYVLGLDRLRETSSQYQMSTVPLFPEGIQKVKDLRNHRLLKGMTATEKIEFYAEQDAKTETQIHGGLKLDKGKVR